MPKKKKKKIKKKAKITKGKKATTVFQKGSNKDEQIQIKKIK